jgi:hypothetical protein
VVAAWLVLASEHAVLEAANATAGGFAVLLLLGGLLFRVPAAIPAALVVLGAEYAAMLAVEDGVLNSRAPVLAAALFAIAELGYWSLELRDAVADEPGTYLRRLGLLSGLTLGALAVGELLLVLVDVSERGGIAIEAVGVVAAVAALAIVAAAGRPRASKETRSTP